MPKILVFHVKHVTHKHIWDTVACVSTGLGQKNYFFIPETAVRSSGHGHDMIMSKIRRKILKKIEDFYQWDLHSHSSLHLTIGQTVFAANFFFPCLRCL